MTTAVIGTGHIGGTLGRAFASAGISTIFGARKPDDSVAGNTGAAVTTVDAAVAAGDQVLLALPGPAVEGFLRKYGDALAGKLVIDAANSGPPSANHAALVAKLAPHARYARSFNTVGWEVVANPDFGGVPADQFFSCPSGDRAALEELVKAAGLRPMYLGDNQQDLVDSVLRLYFALAMGQGHGRELGFSTLTR